MSAGTGPEHADQDITPNDPLSSTTHGTEVESLPAPTSAKDPLNEIGDSSKASTDSTSSPTIPGTFDSSAPASSLSNIMPSNESTFKDADDKPLPAIANDDAPHTSIDSTAASTSWQQQLQQQPGPSSPESELASSMITTVSPVRRSVYKRKMSSKPKGILKPAPPPQKGFSFRRDILQNINTRLAQQGVNVQVPVPQGSTAQATASYIGGMFRKIGGIAAGAAANVSGSNATAVGGFLGNDLPMKSNGSGFYPSNLDGASPSRSSSTVASSSASMASTSQPTEPDSGSTPSLVKSTVASSTASAAPLKKVQFQVSHMTVTYPIAGAGTPEDEDLTRLRIEREHRRMLKARRGKPWTPEELEALYRECCRTREEHPLKKMRLVFQEAAQATPPALKTMDLSFVPLDRHAVEPIADLLSVDFGLNKLVLENCALTDDTVKSILHALLVSGTLPNLSIASNRKIRFRGWKYVAIFMRRARALRYLDLSENSIDRLSLEHLLAVITKPAAAVTHSRATQRVKGKAGENGAKTSKTEGGDGEAVDEDEDGEDSDDEFFDDSGEPLMPTAPLLRDVSDDPDPPSSAIISLRLENCGLKAASLEMLSQAVRFSDIRHLSLRRNKIGQLASVALAIMLKDYPDSLAALEPQQGGGQRSYFDSSAASSSTASVAGDAADRSGRTTLRPPPDTSPERKRSYSPSLPDVPVIVSSPGGGVTSRKMPTHANGDARPTTFYGAHTEQLQDAMATSISSTPFELSLTPQQRSEIRSSAPNLSEEEAVAIYQAKRARRILADLPRVGSLLTLDLKSNDIRGGVVYLAQVLKKNRTLRVLNLSDNNIEQPGLVAVAEALKYNSTLETLDMSHNPCSGLEGITTLRTAFALNSHLKRLFLNDTDLSSEGAIALAEFLPEAKSLIHLDLAENFAIDIAGVMALAVSLKMNRSLRCLDLNIPANDEAFARLSQEILQCCVRNTEAAQERAERRGLGGVKVAAPIWKSVVARGVREREEAVRRGVERGRARVEELLKAAEECRTALHEMVEREEGRGREEGGGVEGGKGDVVQELTKQSATLRSQLGKLAGSVEDEGLLNRILSVHDELLDLSARLDRLHHSSSPPLVAPHATDPSPPVHLTTPDVDESAAAAAGGLSSPAFPIADSDEDSDTPASKLRISTAAEGAEGGEAVEADREELPLAADGGDERSPEKTEKARGQLSEEAELFRKARSLRLDDDAELEEEAEGEEAKSTAATPLKATTDGEDAVTAQGGSSDVEVLQAAVNADVSGEQLRKDLLKVDVPPKSSSPVNTGDDEVVE